MEDLAESKGSQVGSHNNGPGRRLKTYWYITRAGGSMGLVIGPLLAKVGL